MNQYKKYKKLTIDWIDKLPDHWELIKLKHVASYSLSSINRHTSKEEMSVSICHYPYAYKNEFIDSNTNLDKGSCTLEQYEKYKLLKGQIIITKDSESANDIGVPCFILEDIPNATCGYHLGVIECFPESINPKFLFRYIQSNIVSNHFEMVVNGITRFGLSKPTVENLFIPFPSLSEQIQIVKYLDHQTNIINQLIEKKEKFVVLLQEERQAIINEAVTKGLDPKVKMKDSGIEWLGEIPAGWKIVPLRHLGFTQNGVSKGGEYFGKGDSFISYGDVYKNIEVPINPKGLANSTPEDKINYSVKEGDVFFTRTSETIDEIGIASTAMQDVDKAVFAGFLIRFRPLSNRLRKEFSKYFFRSFVTKVFFTSQINLVTRASLSQDVLKGLPVCLPTLNDQNKIGEYLDKKCEIFDRVIDETLLTIQKLKEYRQSLISEAVTGKVDLREWTAPKKELV